MVMAKIAHHSYHMPRRKKQQNWCGDDLNKRLRTKETKRSQYFQRFQNIH
jgi:hypothetical protein